MTAPRVVLVDDTEDLRQLMRIALKRAGYEVVGEAGDGAAGIAVAREQQPDLVVLDLSMPVMDGLEALPHIRTSCPDATIVVMSGFGAAQMSERALTQGADGYLQKGASIRSVVDYLGSALADRRPTPAPVDERAAAPASEDALEVAALRSAIATTAHEIRGPVTVIGGAAETLVSAGADRLDRTDVVELIDAIARQARILDGLTTDLLAAAQARHGTLTLQTRDLRPAEVVAPITDRYDVRLEVADERMVHADPQRLEQVVANLLSNARKYGRPPIVVRIRPAGDRVAIDVTDQGDGVPEEFLTRLFQEFARADSATATGTGLGLHVVRTLAEAQGGSASYARGPEGGAVFTIELPAAG